MNVMQLLKALRMAALRCPNAPVIVGWSYTSAPVEEVELSAGPDGDRFVIEADLPLAQQQQEARDKARLDWLEENLRTISGRRMSRAEIDIEMAKKGVTL